MQVSAEIRWFWQGDVGSQALFDWFVEPLRSADGVLPAETSEARRDVYLRGTKELGIKKRGGKDNVEVKGLVAVRPKVSEPPLTGAIEIWTKWDAPALDLTNASTTELAKQRWVRKFDTGDATLREVFPWKGEPFPERGCNVEFTRIAIADVLWLSFGFEAFGDLETVEDSLHRTVARLAPGCPPPPAGAVCSSYPVWLAGLPK